MKKERSLLIILIVLLLIIPAVKATANIIVKGSSETTITTKVTSDEPIKPIGCIINPGGNTKNDPRCTNDETEIGKITFTTYNINNDPNWNNKEIYWKVILKARGNFAKNGFQNNNCKKGNCENYPDVVDPTKINTYEYNVVNCNDQPSCTIHFTGDTNPPPEYTIILTVKKIPICGDNFIDPGEQCDGTEDSICTTSSETCNQPGTKDSQNRLIECQCTQTICVGECSYLKTEIESCDNKGTQKVTLETGPSCKKTEECPKSQTILVPCEKRVVSLPFFTPLQVIGSVGLIIAIYLIIFMLKRK